MLMGPSEDNFRNEYNCGDDEDYVGEKHNSDS